MTETAMDADGLPVVDETPAPAPEPAPAPTPEPPKAEQAPNPDDTARRGLIAELQEERRARRAEAERAARMEARFQEFQKRFDDLQKPKPAPIPPRDVDPVAHFDARLASIEEPVNEWNDFKRQEAQRREQEAQIEQLRSAVAVAEQSFAAEAPDYYEALNFAKDARTKELQALGYGPTDIPQIIFSEASQIARKAFADGANPAERFYAFAKTRGWAGKPKTEQPRNDDGKFATLQAGAKAQGLGGGSAAPVKDSPTLSDFASMSDQDFEREWAKYEARARREAG